MIQVFTDNGFESVFRKDRPKLLSASYITKEFSMHGRLMHKHDDRLELMYIDTGIGLYIVGTKIYPIVAGDVIVCNADVMHDEIPEANRSLSMYNIGFRDVLLPGLPANHMIDSRKSPILNLGSERGFASEGFRMVFSLLSCPYEGSAETAHDLALALLTHLYYVFHHKGEVLEKSEDNALLTEIRQYIDDHYTEDLTLKTLGERFYISPSRISHVFRAALGYTPINYLSRRRIGEAQSLLIMTRRSITDIAMSVGFRNLTNFNLLFKKYVGLSPKTYRKRYTV